MGRMTDARAPIGGFKARPFQPGGNASERCVDGARRAARPKVSMATAV